jgi:hypothetical protein
MPQQPELFESDDSSTPHRASALKAVGAVLAVAVVPLALVVGHLPERAASTTVQPAALTTPAFVPNWIAIQTGSTSRVTLNGPDGVVATQSLAPAANCGVNLGGSELITLAGSTTPGTVGPYSAGLASYLSGSIGVKEKKSGTSCYQVNAVTTESLKLALGTGVAGALGPDAVATSAYLDVELKGGVRILATATLKGQPVGKWELQSGSERSTPVTAGAVEFECNPAADSGADSNVSDNCRWPISGPSWLGDDGKVFDTLTLEAKAGSFSLEGGADGAVLPAPPYTSTPNASIIEIAPDTLNCGASTPTEPAAGDTPSVSVFRLQNANGLTCDLIPYALENGPNLARFLKALDSQTSAQFIWDIRGPVTKAPQDPHSTDIPITVDYETPDANGNSPLVTLGYCPNPTYTSDGRFAGYTDAQIAALGEDQDDYPGIQYACLISRTAKAIAGTTNTMQVNDLVYVYGDATMRR